MKEEYNSSNREVKMAAVVWDEKANWKRALAQGPSRCRKSVLAKQKVRTV
jgi:hypothetical protein